MNHENINKYLSLRIPEVTESAEKIIQHWKPENAPSHVLYGDTLNNFLFGLLEENTQKEIIIKIFDFYEGIRKIITN